MSSRKRGREKKENKDGRRKGWKGEKKKSKKEGRKTEDMEINKLTILIRANSKAGRKTVGKIEEARAHRYCRLLSSLISSPTLYCDHGISTNT